MLRRTFARRILFLPLVALVLALAGCGDTDRLGRTAETDDPGYREGQSLLKTGRKQEALNSFLRVIDKRGDDAPESHLEVGLLYLEQIHDPLSAIYHFKKYLAINPNSQLAPLVRQRIDEATREFARTIPAQPLETQLQRVDLVAALDRLKQENESLKQELADLRSARNLPPASIPPESDAPPSAPAASAAPARGTPSTALSFNIETIPTVHTRPVPPPVGKPTTPAANSRANAAAKNNRGAPPAAEAKPTTGGRRHTVQAGDTLSRLAQQYYGNRAKWRDIYSANRDVMKNELDLKVGMQLKIP